MSVAFTVVVVVVVKHPVTSAQEAAVSELYSIFIFFI